MIRPSDRWRTGMAAAAAIAIGTALLAGALLAADSVREAISTILGRRVGRASHIITAHHRFFRDGLASAIAAAGAWGACPIITLDGWIVRQPNPSVIPVSIYGVDDRFWAFHRRTRPSVSRTAVLLSRELADELGTAPGTTALLHFAAPPAVSPGVLFGPKDSRPATMALTEPEPLASNELGSFSTNPNQTSIRSVFVSLSALQEILHAPERVNTILLSTNGRRHESAAIAQALRERTKPEDTGIHIEDAGSRVVSAEADSIVMPGALVRDITAALARLDVVGRPVSSYFATAIRAGTRSVPYSFIAGVDPAIVDVPDGSVVLNDWTARQLQVRPGDSVQLDFPVWTGGVLKCKTEPLKLDRVVAMKGAAGDPDLTPEYPGIAGANSMAEWHPPFPMDRSLIRRQDEEYWRRSGAIPKAFLNIGTAERLWGGPLGFVTAIRADVRSQITEGENAVASLRAAVQSAADPLELGFTLRPLRPSADDTARMPFEVFGWCVVFPVLACVAFATVLLRGLPPHRGFLLVTAGVIAGVAAAPATATVILGEVQRWWTDALSGVEPRTIVHAGSLATGGLAMIATGAFCVLLAHALSRRSPGWRIASALLAIAAFLPAAAARFRMPPRAPSGYNVIAESIEPLILNPADPANRDALGIPPFLSWYSFGLRTGEEVGVSNLFRPQNPRIAGAPREFVELMRRRPEWQRLQAQLPDGSMPAIVDRFSLPAVLDGKPGDLIVLNPASDHPVRLQIAGTMHEPALQREIAVSDGNFRRAFPQNVGYRFFLIKASDPGAFCAAVNVSLAAYGFRAEPVADRIAAYHVPVNAYTGMFQSMAAPALLIAAGAFGIHAGRKSGRVLRTLVITILVLVVGLVAATAVVLWARIPIRDFWWAPPVYLGAIGAATAGAIASRRGVMNGKGSP